MKTHPKIGRLWDLVILIYDVVHTLLCHIRYMVCFYVSLDAQSNKLIRTVDLSNCAIYIVHGIIFYPDYCEHNDSHY